MGDTYVKGDRITWRINDNERTGTVVDVVTEGDWVAYYVSPDDRRSTQGLGAPSYPLLVSHSKVIQQQTA